MLGQSCFAFHMSTMMYKTALIHTKEAVQVSELLVFSFLIVLSLQFLLARISCILLLLILAKRNLSISVAPLYRFISDWSALLSKKMQSPLFTWIVSDPILISTSASKRKYMCSGTCPWGLCILSFLQGLLSFSKQSWNYLSSHVRRTIS